MSLVLFEEFAESGISRSSSSDDPANKFATKMWRQWCSDTGRTDAKNENKNFVKAVRAALDNNMSESQISRILSGAARMPPRARDQNDVKRAISPLSAVSARKFALSALDENLPLISFPETSSILTISQVESILETDREDWGTAEIEAANSLMTKYSESELIVIADKVALLVGESALFPSEVIRHAKKVLSGNFKVKIMANRNSYAAGAAESETTDGIDFYADNSADIAFNKNVPIITIREFHNLAPAGYWEKASELLRTGNKSHDEVYFMLEKDFDGWNPSTRQPIVKTKRKI